jgi:cobalt-zinc-cadmium efflux system membrane fusion protein
MTIFQKETSHKRVGYKKVINNIVNPHVLFFLAMAFGSLAISNNALAVNGHNEEHKAGHKDEHKGEHQDEHGEEEGHIEITKENAQKAGIINATAAAGQIKQTTTVYGQTVIDSSAISQVRARFPGLITKLTVNVGDIVTAGENIAQVESSDSLTRYDISAPISGVVTQRHANAGELAIQQPLLTIENYQQLWVEYKIFPSQRQAIKAGQQVTISSTVATTKSSIKHLMANKNQPFIIARVPLDNSEGVWLPGQLLTGSVVTHQVAVNLVIDNRAFQYVEGKKLIFVTNKGGYETRELTLGQTDEQFSQVISGLKVGEQYALSNSYLLKADLGKAGAAHAH